MFCTLQLRLENKHNLKKLSVNPSSYKPNFNCPIVFPIFVLPESSFGSIDLSQWVCINIASNLVHTEEFLYLINLQTGELDDERLVDLSFPSGLRASCILTLSLSWGYPVNYWSISCPRWLEVWLPIKWNWFHGRNSCPVMSNMSCKFGEDINCPQKMSASKL